MTVFQSSMGKSVFLSSLGHSSQHAVVSTGSTKAVTTTPGTNAGSDSDKPSMIAKQIVHGPYIVTVAVDEMGRLGGILGIAVNKDFLDPVQRARMSGLHDVAQYYTPE